MSRGRYRKPTISYQAVRDALDGMVEGRALDEAKSLLALAIVDDVLAKSRIPEMRSTFQVREYLLFHILSNIIWHEYDRLCVQYGFLAEGDAFQLNFYEPLPSIHIPFEIARERFRRDSEYDVLDNWSILYYVYVTMHFNKIDIADLLSRSERMGRRYRDRAIRLLTDYLVKVEWQTHNELHLSWFEAAIPFPANMHLVGRHDELSRLEQIIQHQHPPPVFITGQTGMGKTALASAYVRRYLTRYISDTDHLVWLNEPASLGEIFEQITDVVLRSGTVHRYSIETLLVQLNVVVVIDDAHLLVRDAPLWEALFDRLRSTVLVITSRQFIPPKRHHVHIALSDLPYEVMETLVFEKLQHTDIGNVDDLLPSIWQIVGGNPLGIHLAIGHIANQNPDWLQADVLPDLFYRTYDALSALVQDAWHILAMCIDGRAEQTLFEIIQPGFSQELSVLINYALVNRVTDRPLYQLLQSARQYIGHRLMVDRTLRERVETLILHLIQVIQRGSPLSTLMPLIEGLLIRPELEGNWREALIQQTWSVGIVVGNRIHWRNILGRYIQATIDPDLSVMMGYAVVLRRLGYLDDAVSVLQSVLAASGRDALFDVQRLAYVEYARILRLRGQYQMANDHLQHAHALAVTASDEMIQQQIHYEMARIAIDRGDIQAARIFIGQAPLKLERQILQCEIAYLEKQYDACHEQVARALLMIDETQEAYYNDNRASLMNLLARCYQAQGAYHHAEQYYAMALNLYSRTNHLFGIA